MRNKSSRFCQDETRREFWTSNFMKAPFAQVTRRAYNGVIGYGTRRPVQGAS